MRDFVDKHAPDLFLIQETHLRPEDSFNIPNYRCYRTDRTHPAPGRGGTAVLIKNCIPHYHVPTPPQFTGVEATLIMLTPKDHEPILIGSTYIPPINDYFRNLGAALDTIFNITNMTILVGDFNAKHTSWGCPVNDARGNRLYRYVVNSGIDVIAPLTPTRTPSFEISPPQLYTNWKLFTNNLANNDNLYLPQANSTSEIESQVHDLTSEILTAHANTSKPMIRTEPPFFAGKVGLYRQQVWEEHLTSLDAEDGSLWGTARAFRKKASTISALNGPNGIALSDTNKTELIAQSLESQFQLNNIQNPQKDQVISNIVDAYITDHTNNTDPIPPALPSEIITYIKKIKVKKSPGRDGIINKMIKNLPLLTVFKITNIVNNMFKLRYFPNAWKTAVVIPILKPGKNPKLAESHRPISLLPILSKLAEKIISARDLMTTLRKKISLFRSSTGSVLVSPPPINFYE
ncbi:probable RNA-directed DNA polymerase from transposon X-element [Trichonephila clavipes]|nr:probable RNA-directed DNA polymerase from transposon X-element [Trichonephila clavipes]